MYLEIQISLFVCCVGLICKSHLVSICRIVPVSIGVLEDQIPELWIIFLYTSECYHWITKRLTHLNFSLLWRSLTLGHWTPSLYFFVFQSPFFFRKTGFPKKKRKKKATDNMQQKRILIIQTHHMFCPIIHLKWLFNILILTDGYIWFLIGKTIWEPIFKWIFIDNLYLNLRLRITDFVILFMSLNNRWHIFF